MASGPLLGTDGKFLPGWSKLLGGTDTLEAKFTDPKALVGSYLSLEKLIGAKGIIPPGPNATPEEKSAFFKALGRPDKPEEYGIKMPEKIGDKPFPKELWDDQKVAGFAKWAHEKGWSKQQVQDAIEFDAARGLTAHEGNAAAQQQAKEAATTVLKGEWGAKYAENLAFAEKGAAAGGLTPEILAAKPHLSNDPDYIRAMAKFGQAISETPAAQLRGGGGGGNQGDPAAQISAIMNDKNHPWQPNFAKNGHSPAAHEAAVKEMARLFALKTPGSAA